MSEPRSKMETKTVRIERLKLAFSNVYILSGDRMVLVDTGSPGDDRRILAALEKRGLDRLSLILLTHAHSDGMVPKDTNGDGKVDIASGDKVGVSCALCHTVSDKSVYDMPGGGLDRTSHGRSLGD